ncbi:MAG TPA: hypothetical protein VGK24_05610 [Candidatus Angelobacter sp.]
MSHASFLNPALPTYLWHLLPLDELYKLDTFLGGGLWCAESSTIVAFEGDIEDQLPYGIFMSCWHVNQVPSLKAWEIFAAKGRGLALRTNIQTMQHLVRSIELPDWKINFGPVDYVDTENKVVQPFAVARSHNHESEARLVISVDKTNTLDNYAADRADSFARYHSRDQVARFDSISLVGEARAEAIILPIHPVTFIEEILVGWLTTEEERDLLTRRLDSYGLAHKLRVAQRPI